MTELQPGFKIQTSLWSNGDITQDRTDLTGEISRRIIRTEDREVRRALIRLGWAPPEAGQALRRIAAIAHEGGLIGYSDTYDALNEIRRLSQPWWKGRKRPGRAPARLEENTDEQLATD
jgi:hypothetical protein